MIIIYNRKTFIVQATLLYWPNDTISYTTTKELHDPIYNCKPQIIQVEIFIELAQILKNFAIFQ
jgi:hypothetical protein